MIILSRKVFLQTFYHTPLLVKFLLNLLKPPPAISRTYSIANSILTNSTGFGLATSLTSNSAPNGTIFASSLTFFPEKLSLGNSPTNQTLNLSSTLSIMPLSRLSSNSSNLKKLIANLILILPIYNFPCSSTLTVIRPSIFFHLMILKLNFFPLSDFLSNFIDYNLSYFRIGAFFQIGLKCLECRITFSALPFPFRHSLSSILKNRPQASKLIITIPKR